MNWIEKHCNWIIAIDWLLTGIISWLFIISINQPINTFMQIVLWTILIADIIQVSWMLKIKHQSQWHLLWGFLGWIGIIIWLCLRNKYATHEQI